MKLVAEKRRAGNAKALRADGRLPAVMYNHEINVPISVEFRTFDRIFHSQGTSALIDLEVDGEIHPVLVKAVQMDKRRRTPTHVDFFAVTANQPVDVHVPLEFIGAAPGVKEGGLLDIKRREVFIRILPRLIPGHLEVDISSLVIGSTIHIEDIAGQFPPEAEVLDEGDLTVVTVVPPRVHEAEEEALEEEELLEPEVIGRAAEEEEEE